MRHLIALVTASAALLVPMAAWGSPEAVIRDCASDGSVDGDHSNADKRAALRQLSPELQEYSDCRSVIAASIGGGGAKGSSGSGGGKATSRKAKARRAAARAKARKKARERRGTEVALGGSGIDPSEPGALASDDTSNGISTPLLLALIALGLAGAAGALYALGRRSPRVADAFRRVSFARFRR